MAEVKSEKSWLPILAAALIGVEAIPILVVWLPALLFIVAVSVAAGGILRAGVDLFDLAVLLYPATWAAALVCALRLTNAKRYWLTLVCTLIPLVHMAIVVAWVVIAIG